MRSPSVWITCAPAVLRWARERADLSQETLAKRIRVKPERVADWEKTGNITMGQVERLAQKTYTPVGYLYLPKPPDDSSPITDYRVLEDEPPLRPSPNLLDVVYAMQRRQAWMRCELAGYQEQSPLEFVGAFITSDSPDEVADAMRQTLGLERGWGTKECVGRDWRPAVLSLRDRIEAAGVLIVVDDVAGGDRKRKLDPNEFKGFALSDEYAPLVFINGSDVLSAQMFTMAHELAHIFIAKSGISNFENMRPVDNAVEVFCSAVAAEFLIPSGELIGLCEDEALSGSDLCRTGVIFFRTSGTLIARRALDLKFIDGAEYDALYAQFQLEELRDRERRSRRGGFWNFTDDKVCRSFGVAAARAVEGERLRFLEACSLAGLCPVVFDKYATELGIRFWWHEDGE